MEFKLNDYHRNIGSDELIADMIRVSNELNQEYLKIEQYSDLGKYDPSTIMRRFNGWNNALMKAGLKIMHPKNAEQRNIRLNDKIILEDIARVAKDLNTLTINSMEYAKYGLYGKPIVFSRFGTWDNALQKAGLEPTKFHHKITDEELLKEIEEIWIKLGRQPTSTDIKGGISKYSLNSYSRHFGSWRKALETFVEYINSNEDENNNETVESDFKDNPDKTHISNQSELISKNHHKTKRDINLRLRFIVMQRDNFKCCMCGASPATDPSVVLHIDHIKPWSKGGETTIDNLQTLCSKCNLGKSDLEL